MHSLERAQVRLGVLYGPRRRWAGDRETPPEISRRDGEDNDRMVSGGRIYNIPAPAGRPGRGGGIILYGYVHAGTLVTSHINANQIYNPAAIRKPPCTHGGPPCVHSATVPRRRARHTTRVKGIFFEIA